MRIASSSQRRTQVLYGRYCDATKGLASRAARVWLLSGTPIPNGLHEMWAHARALFPKAVSGLESYSAWMNHFCYTERGDFGVRVMDARHIEDFVERFHPYIKRRLLKDVQPDLPPIRYSNVVVQPNTVPAPLAHVVEQETVLRAALARARGGAGNGDEIAALAAIDTMHISSLHKWTGITKAPAVAEYIAAEMQQGSRKVVIFAKHSEVFEVLKKTLPGRGAVINGQTATNKRQPIIDEFQGRVADKVLDWLAVHIDIASTAIDLTAANDVVFAETTWVPKDVQQAAMRCMGVNQTKPVLARIMSLKGSIDEAISDTIVRKYRTISKIETHFTN
jgi:SWI/SNF-related matrix-associated actin-dependent regulator of chromatin subfamily A-like protein 1